MMNKVFTQNGWEDYVYWETEDKKDTEEDQCADRGYMQEWQSGDR